MFVVLGNGRERPAVAAKVLENVSLNVRFITAASTNGELRRSTQFDDLEQLASSKQYLFAILAVDATRVAVKMLRAEEKLGMSAQESEDLEPVLHMQWLLQVNTKRVLG